VKLISQRARKDWNSGLKTPNQICSIKKNTEVFAGQKILRMNHSFEIESREMLDSSARIFVLRLFSGYRNNSVPDVSPTLDTFHQ
jgi:hypothetical protein